MYRRLSSYSPEYQLIDENENFSITSNGFKIGGDGGAVLVGLSNLGNNVTISSYVFIKVTVSIKFTGYMTDPYAKSASGYATFSMGTIKNGPGIFPVTLNWSGYNDWYNEKTATIEGAYFVKEYSSTTSVVDVDDGFGDYGINLTFPFQIRSITRNSLDVSNIDIRLEYSGRYRIEGVPK